MRNQSLGLLLLIVVVISMILAATELVSISGAFLLVALMTLALVAVRQERVRYEKRYLAEKLHLERLFYRSNKKFFKQN